MSCPRAKLKPGLTRGLTLGVHSRSRMAIELARFNGLTGGGFSQRDAKAIHVKHAEAR